MTQPQEGSRQDVREQADEYSGFVRSGKVKAHKTGEEFVIPSLLLLDDDQQIAYEALQHKLNQCDRYPDTEVPERRITVAEGDGETTETVIAAHTVRGDFIQPYQKDGELLSPPYAVQMAQILFGEKEYKRFKAAGGRSNEIMLEMMRMRDESNERRLTDSKSGGGAAKGEEVSAGD